LRKLRRREEVRKVLEKLPEKDREMVVSYIENHEARIRQLEQNLAISGDILQAILEQVQSIQASLNAILRSMRPVLRVRPQQRADFGER